MYEHKPLPFDKELDGISKKTNDIHHGKLYKGYVDKANEIGEKLEELRKDILDGKESGGNQTYSKLRALKQGETFAVNGVYLHEWFFGVLGGDGDHSKGPELADAIVKKWGSIEDFIKYFTETAMAARGWAILAWDPKAIELMQYNGDAHNQAVWGAMPVIALDVYEHAYFIDHGSDRKAYIQAFFKNLDWGAANEFFKKASVVNF